MLGKWSLSMNGVTVPSQRSSLASVPPLCGVHVSKLRGLYTPELLLHVCPRDCHVDVGEVGYGGYLASLNRSWWIECLFMEAKLRHLYEIQKTRVAPGAQDGVSLKALIDKTYSIQLWLFR